MNLKRQKGKLTIIKNKAKLVKEISLMIQLINDIIKKITNRIKFFVIWLFSLIEGIKKNKIKMIGKINKLIKFGNGKKKVIILEKKLKKIATEIIV